MKRAFRMSVMLALAVGLNGCKKAYAENEAIIKDMIKCLNDFADALESVKDPETAKAAATKISQTADEMEALGKKAEKAPKLSKADNDKLENTYMPELEKAQKRFESVAPQAGVKSGGEPTFQEALKKWEQAGTNLQKIGKK